MTSYRLAKGSCNAEHSWKIAPRLSVRIRVLVVHDPLRLEGMATRVEACFRKEWAIRQWETLDAVERATDGIGGASVFRNICVAVADLFENLHDGTTIDYV